MTQRTEQTHCTRSASRFTRFVCPSVQSIPHEPRKKTLIPLKLKVIITKYTATIFSNTSYNVSQTSEYRPDPFLTPSSPTPHSQTRRLLSRHHAHRWYSATPASIWA